MRKESFLEGEEVITISKGGLVTLTTHRIRLERTHSGQSYIVSMILKKISSIEVNSQSIPLLWIMAALAGLASIYSLMVGSVEMFLLLIVVALIFFIGYYKNKKHLITIKSDGTGKIHFRTQGLSSIEVIQFINQVENAALQQLNIESIK